MICRFVAGSILRRPPAVGAVAAVPGPGGRSLADGSVRGCCGGAVANSRLCVGASTVGPDKLDVGLDLGVGVGLVDDRLRGVDVGLGLGRIIGVGLGLGSTNGVGVGLGDGFRVAVGVGLGSSTVAVGVGDGLGEGVSASCFSASSISSLGVGDALTRAGVGLGRSVGTALAFAVGIEPGSDQPPVFSPFTNSACNLVFPCCRITGPSNFPRTIFPV